MTRFLASINRFFALLGSWLQSPLLLILRLFFGFSLMFIGIVKLQDINKVVDSLTSLNIPLPEAGAWAISLTESIGGFLLAIGFLSRFAALLIAFGMSVAYATAHVESLYVIAQDPKIFISQSPFNYLLVSLLVFAFGPGLFSIDALLGKPNAKGEYRSPK